MAVIAPFQAVRYDAAKVGGLEKVLTQPYDKISPEMQKECFARSPYNLVYIEKGEINQTDTPADNVYTRAASRLKSWLEQGILLESEKPALYAYFQEFRVPGQTSGPTMIRRGFIGRGKLENYDSNVIFRHELTLSAPKADRLDLLRATRAHTGQIFMLYSDKDLKVDKLLEHVSKGKPHSRLVDDYGTIHTMWEIANPKDIEFIQKSMSDKSLVIADGHHRYETALNFQRECKESKPHTGGEDCSYTMMTFINTEAEGLAVLPTHRVVTGVPDFTRDGFLSRASRYFTGKEYAYASDADRASVAAKFRADLAATGSHTSIGVMFKRHNSYTLLQLRDEAAKESVLKDLSPAERSLDVNVLHKVAFGLCLGMDEESFSKEKFLTYVREFEEGEKSVLQGDAQACFFLNSARVQQVMEIATSGKVLPQKSTDFYPKLLSGMTIYQLKS